MIVLHYTGMETAQKAFERLCDPDSGVSAHYLIDEDGKTECLIGEECRAWHAGMSHWDGQTDINSASVGIEIVNPGHEFGYRPFPEVQIQAVVKVCHGVIARYDISPDRVLAHSDVAPGRKTDPGELFPWETLAAQGVGLWPAPEEMDFQAAGDMIAQKENVFFEGLTNYGYNPLEEPGVVITAFHRHFYPEKFGAGNVPEEPDVLSAAKLLSLLRQKYALKT